MEFGDLISIPRVDHVILTDKTKERTKSCKIEGTLCISGHHLILSDRQKNSQQELWLLYRNIDVMEKKINNQIPGGSIILKCKDFHIYQLDFGSTNDLVKVAQSIEKLSCLDQTLQYPFFYRPQSLSNSKVQIEDGWTAFQPLSEWSRLLAAHGDEWRICHLNRDYKVCSSYSADVIVPRHIEDEIIVSSANFRDSGRFPVLCYRHDGGGILIRSSQPMCGPTGKRCKGDEMLLNSYLRPGKRGVIVDTRSLTQAQNARTKGGGTEIDAAYPQWLKSHKTISRATDLSESLSKLVEACNDLTSSTSQWLSRVDNSKWLSAVQDAMNAACVTAQCLEQEQTAVLVHGGSGRDTTLIVTSLVQAILNPDCRTVRGLQALIEREWLQAGHAFYTRTRHGAYYTYGQNPQDAPTFLLFLDCLYQLHHQFQQSFEYTTEMLVEIFKHAYSSNYGTFLGDSESERTRLKLSDHTFSLWSYMNQPDVLEKYMNPLYDPNPGIIWPSVAPVSIELWRELYLGHNAAAPWDGLLRCVLEIKDKHQSIKRAAVELHQQIRQAFDESDQLLSDNNSSSSAASGSCTYNNSQQLGLQEDTIHRKLSQLSLEQSKNT
ncbi:myotubularin-related protein 9 [Nasonia vitripennis]|uniref:Myotubularin phosphatase domain-containing protein n=1 Tax=Nasonia vitripennis TaxID=7425 RepID=A0A7M7TC15_NASVI|nr:myotubularin-related protein 9 [Nasonia vitripennis]